MFMIFMKENVLQETQHMCEEVRGGDEEGWMSDGCGVGSEGV